MSSCPLPSALDIATRGAKLCVVSMDRHGAFLLATQSCMFGMCTGGGLKAPEPHRSSPKGRVSDVLTAKGLPRLSEQSPMPHARVSVSFNTNPCTSRFGVSQFLLTKLWLLPSCFLPACHFLLDRGRLHLMADHPLSHPYLSPWTQDFVSQLLLIYPLPPFPNSS